MGQTAGRQPTLLPEISAQARVTIERLTADGEIRVLQVTEIEGVAIYHVEARVKEDDVVYDVTNDGTVLLVDGGDAG